jgi:hypothetical protein
MVLPVRILSDFGPKCEFFPHPFQTPNQHPNNLVQGIICICHHGSVSTEAHSSKVQVCGRATMNSLWLSWARACPVTACANGVQATRHGTFFPLWYGVTTEGQYVRLAIHLTTIGGESVQGFGNG